MNALRQLIWEALVEAWYPEVPEGRKRRIRVNAGGVALALVLTVGYLGYTELTAIRAELAEVKTTSTKIWNALLERGIASAASVAAAPTPTPPPTTWPSGWAPVLVPSAHAAEVP